MTTAVCDKKNQGLTCEQVSNKCEDTGYNVGGEMYFAQQGLKKNTKKTVILIYAVFHSISITQL